MERSVKQAEGVVELGPLKTARRGIATRTLPVPLELVDDVRLHLREHAQLGREGLLFWRNGDGGVVRSADWLRVFKRACRLVADEMEAEAARSGRPESEESQRIREQLTGKGVYVFHGTRVTGLTWAYRLSGGNLRAVQAMGGHTSSKMALRYQRAELEYLNEVADTATDAPGVVTRRVASGGSASGATTHRRCGAASRRCDRRRPRKITHDSGWRAAAASGVAVSSRNRLEERVKIVNEDPDDPSITNGRQLTAANASPQRVDADRHDLCTFSE